jgi:hypothetical protein
MYDQIFLIKWNVEATFNVSNFIVNVFIDTFKLNKYSFIFDDYSR